MNDTNAWALTDPNGGILDRFATDDEARDALDTGEYPDGTELAYVEEPDFSWLDDEEGD